MLNFINNKFRKIIISNIILGHCFTNNIYAGYNLYKKEDDENNKKKGYSGKNKNNEEDVIDTKNQDNNTNTNNNDNKNINNENLIKSKKEKLLKILEEIKNDNKYLSDKIEDKIINNLKNKIENINNSNISNIENELNDLRNTINSRFDKIKENYINTVTNINNSIEILENYNKGKYQLQKYTLNIDEVNKTKFNKIKDLNDTLEGIKKGYNDSINEIVKNLKIEFNKLKDEKLKDKELDVKKEDFDNLTEATKIIDIDKKLLIYNIKLKGNKTEIINKINPINKKLEKCKGLIKNLLKIEFVKKTNLNNKNIEDLITIYNKLSELDNNLLVAFNEYKTKQQDKYKELNIVYNEFKDTFNFNFVNLKLDFNDYKFENYKEINKKIEEFEKIFNRNIDNIKKEYDNRIKKLENIYKEKEVKREINIDTKIDNTDKLNDKYGKLKLINDEIQKKEKTLKYIVTRTLSKKEMENIYDEVLEMKKNISFKCVHQIYSPEEDKYNNNVVYTVYNTEEDVSNLVKRLDEIKLDHHLYFELKLLGIHVLDFGGVRRQRFEEMTNYILNDKKINLTFYDIDNENLKTGSYNLFNKIKGYSIDSEENNYNNFKLINESSNNEHKLYYKLLAYLCAYSLIDNSTLKINFNPLIYKIMLNFDFTKKYNEEQIKEKLKEFITYDDLKYFSTGTYEYLKENFDKEEACFDYVDGEYERMINHFFYQIDGIKTFYENLSSYMYNEGSRYCKNFFEKFKKDEFWNLKLFIEGKSKITSDDILSIINIDRIMKSKKNLSNKEIINDYNADTIVNCFKEVLREFEEDQLKDFLRWISGSTTIPHEFYFQFNNDTNIDKSLIYCHSCGLYFDLHLGSLSQCIGNFDFINKNLTKDQEKTVKETLKIWLTGAIVGSNFNKA